MSNLEAINASNELSEVLSLCVYEGFTDEPEPLDVDPGTIRYKLESSELKAAAWNSEYANKLLELKGNGNALIEEKVEYKMPEVGGPYAKYSNYGLNGWVNLKTRKWEWFRGYPREFSAKLSNFCYMK